MNVKPIVHYGLIFMLFLFSCSSGKNDDLKSFSGSMKSKAQWIMSNLYKGNQQFPFSFVLDGKPSDEWLKNVPVKSESVTLDKFRIQRTLTWNDLKTGLEVRCVAVEYNDFPVVEWTVYLKNTGSVNTPNIKDIQGLDCALRRGVGGEFILNGIKGDYCTADSYEPYQLTLSPGLSKTFAPARSGKSCDGPKGWPYFNLQLSEGGIILAVGWPGQWAASFTRDNQDGLVIKAGQQQTNLYLKPGEEIRTPSTTFLFWKGEDVIDSQNLWRRFYLAHILPVIEGLPQQPVMQIQVGAATADTAYVGAFLKAGITPNVAWRDAGGAGTWYPSKDGPYKGNDAWLNTGTWDIDPAMYPNGFRAFTDWIHRKGIKFVLWFEPERVGDPNSWLSQNHPEWLLPGTSHGALLDEGNPEALKWLIDHVDRMIKSQGIDWYREDMNGGGPLPAWQKNDAPDRQGITENHYIQGHLTFWDELKRRNPHLHIDACASGGRRNDLETMRRAVPLLRSDFQWNSMPHLIEGNQGHTYGLSSWLPFQGTGVYFYDAYSFRSFYITGFGMGGLNPENTAAQQQAYKECSQIAPDMLFGDYYPLTTYSLRHNQWIGWQFNNREKNEGVVQAFRRDSCDLAVKNFRLKGLDPNARYEVKNFDEQGSKIISGQTLVNEGLAIEIKEKPGSAIVTYKMEDKAGK